MAHAISRLWTARARAHGLDKMKANHECYTVPNVFRDRPYSVAISGPRLCCVEPRAEPSQNLAPSGDAVTPSFEEVIC